MKSTLVSFISGFVFALGLGIGGMTQPAKVIGFLDFAGNWDPSLAFVMLGAIGVHSLFYRVIRTGRSPLFSMRFSLPKQTEIDSRLIAGSVIFGLGWGIAGFCPGPALTSLVSGNLGPVIFSAGMIIGIIAFDLRRVLSARQARPEHASGEIIQDL
ncbi:MAG: DUF6691 family protein [Candidatus Binatia bacterium]